MVQQQYSLQLPGLWTSLVSVASFTLAFLRLQVPSNNIPKSPNATSVMVLAGLLFASSLCVKKNIYLSMKEVVCFVLFCSCEIHQTGMLSDRVLGVFGKLLTRRGAWAWFHDIWTCGTKVLEY
jgi:hypothetical protein